jgi:hypothetical protein
MEFSAVAVRRNDEGIYEVAEDFDIEDWRQTIFNSKPQRYCVDLLRDLKFCEQEIQPLAKLIMDQIGCGRSRAYELVREAVKARIWRYNKTTETYVKI